MDDKAKKQEEAKEEFGNSGLTISDILQSIDEAVKGRTSIVIAHRLSTIKHADKIIVIEDGRIQETGGLQELLEKKGRFHTFWSEQKFD